MKIKISWHLAISLLGGILMGLTTAPVNAWPLAWIALVPLWISVFKNQKPTTQFHPLSFTLHRSSFTLHPSSFILHPLLWGIGYHGIALFWITGIHPMTWLGVPWWPSLAIAIFCWTFITLWGAALVTTWAIASKAIYNLIENTKSPLKNSLFRILIGTTFWCALETFWSWGDLWWTSLSYTQSPHNLSILHLAQISGPNTITAAIVIVNAIIGEAWINRRINHKQQDITNLSAFIRVHLRSLNKKYLIATIYLLTILHLLGFFLYNRPLIKTPENALKVGIIQGNIPNQIKFNSAGWYRAIEGYTTGYRDLVNQGVDAVLIPETALPFIWTDPNQIPRSFYSAVLEKGVVAWVGGFGQEGNNFTNSLFTISGNGNIFSRYDKVKLVPLGEYIPFEEIVGKLIDRLSPLDAHLVKGKPNQIFETPFGRAIVGICYDSAFAKLFRRQAAAGGQFILSASNDAHYKASMAAQHHAQDVIRAIENDRWTLRATNTGYSAIVDPHGRTLWISKINTYEIHAATIYRQQSQTLYVRWGDWLTPLLLAIVMTTTAGEYYYQRVKSEV